MSSSSLRTTFDFCVKAFDDREGSGERTFADEEYMSDFRCQPMKLGDADIMQVVPFNCMTQSAE